MAPGGGDGGGLMHGTSFAWESRNVRDGYEDEWGSWGAIGSVDGRW